MGFSLLKVLTDFRMILSGGSYGIFYPPKEAQNYYDTATFGTIVIYSCSIFRATLYSIHKYDD